MKRLLICDDDADIVDMVCMITEDRYDVVTETNSSALIQAAISARPDVILLDMWMPKISGDRLAGMLRALPEFNKTPIIIFSASKDGQQKAMDAGADYFLSKPFDIDQLLEVLDQSYSGRAA